MIKLENICKVFRTEDIETRALADINLEINKGEFVAIMGPSGCGKSTLLNTIGMLDCPTSGKYIFLNENIASYKEKQLSKIRKDNLGYIFQDFNLVDTLTVYQNVELPLLYQNVNQKERKSQVEKVLKRMNIEHRRDHYPKQLSGGQQQRVAASRALVTEPKLILADEPTGNLDSKNGQEVMEMLTEMKSLGATIVMVTHSEEHAQYADKNVYLKDGQIVQEL